jgi:hypothetical protein
VKAKTQKENENHQSLVHLDRMTTIHEVGPDRQMVIRFWVSLVFQESGQHWNTTCK